MRVLLIGVVLYLSIVYLDGIVLEATRYGIVVSFFLLLLIFSFVEVLIYPIVKMLILPLRLLTFGFASAVLSVNFVYVIAFVYPFFSVTSFWHALLVGFGIGFVRLLTK